MSLSVTTLASDDLTRFAPILADLLVQVVDGAVLGFVAPVAYDDALRYWLSLRADVAAGTRVVFVARDGDRIVGSGQLALTQWPNAQHRAEVQKLFVCRAARGRGIARAIMAALHAAAREHGRSLLLLGARWGAPAELLYRSLGYRAIGVIPGYAMDGAGRRHDNVTFYLELT